MPGAYRSEGDETLSNWNFDGKEEWTKVERRAMTAVLVILAVCLAVFLFSLAAAPAECGQFCSGMCTSGAGCASGCSCIGGMCGG